MNKLAPIVLFVYNRPWHTEQTLTALMQNDLADQSVLYIYADGAKENATEKELKKIYEVRQQIRKKKWCKEVHIIEAEKNKGLADSIIDGVTQVINQHGKIIVLEDDIVTSKGFLKYMNEALLLYEKESKVMEVSAFMFAIDNKTLPDTFFYNANSCWGWGTWKRAWNNYNNDPLDLYLKLINSKIDWYRFNAYQGNAFKEQLLANVEGTMNTWAVKWHATMQLFEGFVLHPKRSLVKNIGFDGSGTNCVETPGDEITALAETIHVEKKPIMEDPMVQGIIRNYFQALVDTQISSKIPREPFVFRLMKKGIKTIPGLKKIRNNTLPAKNKLIPEGEFNRLQNTPRYIPTQTVLFNKKIYLPDALTYLSSVHEIFENEIYKFQPESHTDITIFDCGANIGLATIYFKKNFPDAKIIAYEPDSNIYESLKANISSFGYIDIELINAAVSNSTGEVNFQTEGGHSGMITTLKEVENIIRVKSIRLKNELQKFEHITFLKIDIEGHETELLPDIAAELKRVKFLFLEYHSFSNKEQQLENILSIIKRSGFRYYIKEAYNKPFPFINKEIFLGMDLLVNIFCYRD